MPVLFKRGEWLHLRYYHPLIGRTISIKTGFKATKEGEREARKFQREFELKLRLGQVPLKGMAKGKTDDSPLTLEEGYSQFLKDNPKMAKKTRSMNDRALELFKQAAGIKAIKEYSRRDAYLFLDYLETVKGKKGKPLAHNSQAAYTRQISGLFGYFTSERIIDYNPIKILPPEDKDPEPIPLDILRGMLQMLKDKGKFKQYYFVKFLLLTGLRAGEAVSLKWSDVHFEERYLSFRNFKAKRDEALPLIDEAYNLLKEMPHAYGESLFGYKSYDSTKTFWTNLNKDYEKKLKEKDAEAKCDYTIHQIRKATSSYLANMKVHGEFIQKYIRHVDFDTTETHYIKWENEAIREELNNKVHFNMP